MYKFIKYFSITIIVLIAVAFVAPYFINLDKYKDVISAEVKNATGRDLIIGDKIELSLIPYPTVILQKIKLSSIKDTANPFILEVKKVKVALSVSELLVGRLGLSSLELDEPKFNLETLSDGSVNWQLGTAPASDTTGADKTGADSTSASPAKTESEKSSFFVKRIAVNKGKVEYIKNVGQSRNVKVLDEIDLSASMKSAKGPFNFSVSLNGLGNKLAIQGEIAEIAEVMPITANIKVLGEDISISGNVDMQNSSFQGSVQASGNTKNMKALTGELPQGLLADYTLGANIAANKELVKINDLKFSLGELAATGGGYYNIIESDLDLNLQLMPGDIKISLAPLTAQGSTIANKVAVDVKTPKDFIAALKMDIKDAQVLALLNQPLSFTADAEYQPRYVIFQRMALNVSNASIKGMLGLKNVDGKVTVFYNANTENASNVARLFNITLPISLFDLRLKGETKQTDKGWYTSTNTSFANATIGLSGIINAAAPNLDISLTGDNLGQTMVYLFKTSPGTKLGNFAFFSNISGENAQNFKVKLNDSTVLINNEKTVINGNAAISLTAAKPKISGDLQISTINLGADNTASQVAQKKSEAAEPVGQKQVSRWSQEKIDLSALQRMDGDFNIALQKLIKGALVFDTIKAKLKLANGALTLSSLSGGLYGGTLDASGQISSLGDNNSKQPFSLKASLKGAQLKNMTPEGNKIKVTSGIVNFTTSLQSSGASALQYVSNLRGDAKLDGKDGKISGIDLQKIASALQNFNDFNSIAKVLDGSFTGQETAFKTLEGSLAINNGIAEITKCKLEGEKFSSTATGQINLPKYSLDINANVTAAIKNMPPLSIKFYGSLDSPNHKIDMSYLKERLLNGVVDKVLDKLGGDSQKILKGILGK